MKQKVVIKVTMNGQKSRSKALKIVVGASGVESAAWKGDNIEVTGEGLDPTCLTLLLRKKLGYADLVSVEEKKEEKKEDVAKLEVTAMPALSYYASLPYVVRDPYYEQNNCSIISPSFQTKTQRLGITNKKSHFSVENNSYVEPRLGSGPDPNLAFDRSQKTRIEDAATAVAVVVVVSFLDQCFFQKRKGLMWRQVVKFGFPDTVCGGGGGGGGGNIADGCWLVAAVAAAVGKKQDAKEEEVVLW
ncbi:hypothetical protein Q3G72_008805 [Acer saccharum]|nr:hypothetical protein Q3G72_008805 [Acer saccharum]